MGFKGAKPFCESLSTFFSEESRGPSRPERQVKRDLRGKSQAEKGKRQKKNARTSAWQAAAAQTRPSAEVSDNPQAGNKAAAYRQKKAGAPYTKAATTAAGRARTTSPAHGAAHRAQKNPSEQAKFAFALLPARRGLVNRGRQKIASLFLAGTVFFCFALRTAPRAVLHKGGAAPFYPLQAF